MRLKALSIMLCILPGMACAGYGYQTGDLLGAEDITIYGEHDEGYDSAITASMCSVSATDNANFFFPGFSRKEEYSSLTMSGYSGGKIHLSLRLAELNDSTNEIYQELFDNNVEFKIFSSTGNEVSIKYLLDRIVSRDYTVINTYTLNPFEMQVSDNLTLSISDSSYYRKMSDLVSSKGARFSITFDLKVLCK